IPLLSVCMLGISACGDAQVARDSAAVRDSLAALAAAKARADSARRADSVRTDSLRLDSIRVDSIHAAAPREPAQADTIGTKADSLSPLTAGKGVRRKKLIARLRASELARWPVKGPEPLPGALLPKHRIIAYYGNPLSKRMGILGQIPSNEMMERLA